MRHLAKILHDSNFRLATHLRKISNRIHTGTASTDGCGAPTCMSEQITAFVVLRSRNGVGTSLTLSGTAGPLHHRAGRYADQLPDQATSRWCENKGPGSDLQLGALLHSLQSCRVLRRHAAVGTLQGLPALGVKSALTSLFDAVQRCAGLAGREAGAVHSHALHH